jgi:hypothetical protein
VKQGVAVEVVVDWILETFLKTAVIHYNQTVPVGGMDTPVVVQVGNMSVRVVVVLADPDKTPAEITETVEMGFK